MMHATYIPIITMFSLLRAVLSYIQINFLPFFTNKFVCVNDIVIVCFKYLEMY